MPVKIAAEDILIVTVAIQRDDGNLLVVHRPLTEETNPDFWEFPGGHRDEGESIEEAARREIKEEVGLEVELLPGYVTFPLKKKGHGVMLKARLKSRIIRLKLKEHDGFLWVSTDQISKLKPTYPDFEQNVRKLMQTKPKVAGRQAKMEWMDPTERQKAEEATKDTQAIFTSLDQPDWQSVWNLQDLDAPDWNNFSLKQVPEERETVLDRHMEDGAQSSETKLYIKIRDALDEAGALDYTQLTKGDGAVEVKTLIPDADYVVTAALKSAKVAFKRLAFGRFLAHDRNRKSYYDNTPNIPEAQPTGPQQSSDPNAPPQTTIKLQQQPVQNPADQLQKMLGPDSKVMVDPGNKDQLVIQTPQPSQTIQKAQQAIQTQHLPLKMAARLRKASLTLEQKYRTASWFRQVLPLRQPTPRLLLFVNMARSARRVACGCALPDEAYGIPVSIIQVGELPGVELLKGSPHILKELFDALLSGGKENVEFDDPPTDLTPLGDTHPSDEVTGCSGMMAASRTRR